MTDTNYSTQQHSQYITNKSFAEQIARLESRVAALESALAQPEQEPVAEVHTFLVGSPYAIVRVTGEMDLEDELFLTAPPSKPWVSLTDEEFDNIYYRHDTYDSFARAIEAALKEKNT